MQQINQAYAADDLLTLLETQLQIEQVDTRQIAGINTQRLRHYNKVLAEQLTELRAETARVEADSGSSSAWSPSSASSRTNWANCSNGGSAGYAPNCPGSNEIWTCLPIALPLKLHRQLQREARYDDYF